MWMTFQQYVNTIEAGFTMEPCLQRGCSLISQFVQSYVQRDVPGTELSGTGLPAIFT